MSASVPVAPVELCSRATAEAYVSDVCFNLRPHRLVGAELEWLTGRIGDTRRRVGMCVYDRPYAATLARALGSHAPLSVNPNSACLPLPAGGQVSIEPGGQVEISSRPVDSATELCHRLARDADTLSRLLATQSVRMIAESSDGQRPPQRILTTPRYRAMEHYFDQIGPFGRLMMCNTAAVQICVESGADADELYARWSALHAIGPALVAAFAASPDLYGTRDRCASQRMQTWLKLDPRRTAVAPNGTSPQAEYARWALDVPLLCVRRTDDTRWNAPPGATFADWLGGALDDEIGRRPDVADLDYHLTTLFPPVRAHGYLEVRYLDAHPGAGWTTAIHAVTSLMSTPAVVAEATRIAAAAAGRWQDAARLGIADEQLRAAADQLLELAAEHAETATVRTQLGTTMSRHRTGAQPKHL